VALPAIAELGLLLAIGDRLLEREVTSAVFVVLANLGHLAMIAAVWAGTGAGAALPLFAALMLAGELIKVVFLRTTGFTVRGHSTDLLTALTAGYAAIAAAVLVLAVAG